jgi:hypothetical protein
MVRDVENDPRFELSSSTDYSHHPNFQRIIALGRPIVPTLIAEMKAGENRRYHAHVLDLILADVDLGTLYAQPHYFRNTVDLHHDLWLRWWDETGHKQSWE